MSYEYRNILIYIFNLSVTKVILISDLLGKTYKQFSTCIKKY